MNDIVDVVNDFDERHFRIMIANMLTEFLLAKSRGAIKTVKHLVSEELYNKEESENKIIYNNISLMGTRIVRQMATDSYFVAVMETDLECNIGVENSKNVKMKFLLTLKKEIKPPNPMAANLCPNCNVTVNRMADNSCKYCGALYNITTEDWLIIDIKEVPFVDENNTNILFTIGLIVITVGIALKYQKEIFGFLGDVYNSEYFMSGVLVIGSLIGIYIIGLLVRFLFKANSSKRISFANEEYINSIIPGYNRGEFEKAFYKVFEYILISKASYNNENMSKYISDLLNKKYTAEIKRNKKKKYINVLKEMNLENINIIYVNNVNNVVELALFVSFSYVGYLTTKKNKLIEGNDKGRTNSFYKLKFVKDTSKEGSNWVLDDAELLNQYYLVD